MATTDLTTVSSGSLRFGLSGGYLKWSSGKFTIYNAANAVISDLPGSGGGGAAPFVYLNAVGATLDAARLEAQPVIAGLVAGQTLIVRLRGPQAVGGGSTGPGILQTTAVNFSAADSKADVRVIYEGSRGEWLTQGLPYGRENVVLSPVATGNWGVFLQAQGIGADNPTSEPTAPGYAFVDGDFGLSGNPATGTITARLMVRNSWQSSYFDWIIDQRFGQGNSFWDTVANYAHTWKIKNASARTLYGLRNTGPETDAYVRYYTTPPVANSTGPMVTITNCPNLTFRNFYFKSIYSTYNEFYQGQSGQFIVSSGVIAEAPCGGINIINSPDFVLENCRFENLSGNAVSFDITSLRPTFINNDFKFIGCNAINQSQVDTSLQTCERVTIEKNNFYDIGKFVFGGVPIALYKASKARVTNNKMTKFSGAGIVIGNQYANADFGQVNNLIQNNYIEGGCEISADVGPGIYNLALNPGLEISRNTIICSPRITVPSVLNGAGPIRGAEGSGCLYMDNSSQGIASNPIVMTNNRIGGLENTNSTLPVFYQELFGSTALRANIVNRDNTYRGAISQELFVGAPNRGLMDYDNSLNISGNNGIVAPTRTVSAAYTAGVKCVFTVKHSLGRPPQAPTVYCNYAVGSFPTGSLIDAKFIATSSTLQVVISGSLADAVGVGIASGNKLVGSALKVVYS